MAWCVIIVIAGLEIYILRNMEKWGLFGDSWIFLAIAPIASVTFIVISVMIGVFKQPGDPEVKVSDVFPLSRLFRGGGEG